MAGIWLRNPIFTAIGRNIAARPTSFKNVAITVGLIFLIAFFPSNDAPIHISATGVAVCAILLIALLIITGYLNPAREDNNPSTIPIIIGLVTILKHAFLMFSFLSVDCSSVLP